MTELTGPQAAEVEKYVYNYAHLDPKKGRYAMGKRRYQAACENLNWAWDNRVTVNPTYLDIGCGRGEMLKFGEDLGFHTVGTEVVEALCSVGESDWTPEAGGLSGEVWWSPAWDRLWGQGVFDLVTMFDVLEHLLPEDTIRTLREIKRIAKGTIFLTANNRPDVWNGFDMHVNRRPYDEWDRLLKVAFVGCTVTRLPKERNISETWRIDI